MKHVTDVRQRDLRNFTQRTQQYLIAIATVDHEILAKFWPWSVLERSQLEDQEKAVIKYWNETYESKSWGKVWKEMTHVHPYGRVSSLSVPNLRSCLSYF